MNTIRILHVDNEPDIRELVELSLSLNSDFEVRSCASGDEAIAAAAEWSPLLILLDVMMPRMDDPTTLSHLRKNPHTSDIPVLFLTVRTEPRKVERYIALGAKGVIPKPFEPIMLGSTALSYLEPLGRA